MSVAVAVAVVARSVLCDGCGCGWSCNVCAVRVDRRGCVASVSHSLVITKGPFFPFHRQQYQAKRERRMTMDA